mmetsp:Transcript_21955/g.51493  ORF Transcript_21955/g.51493 Transcript_21955/m.51493 type:complete len:236 (-) Transcript_21955:8-715(-)
MEVCGFCDDNCAESAMHAMRLILPSAWDKLILQALLLFHHKAAKPGAVDQPAIGSEGHDDECRRGHGHKMGQRQYGAQDTSADGGLGQVGGHRGPHQPVPARADAVHVAVRHAGRNPDPSATPGKDRIHKHGAHPHCQEESPSLLHLILLCSQSSDERLQHFCIFGLCGERILQLIRSAGGADREGVHKDVVQHEDSGGRTGQLEAIDAHLAQSTGPDYLPPTSVLSHVLEHASI